ncbi:unnamed protein product [Parnassius mnemosyne]|uniref:FP protein C-terminal domain-containing protein n=1 Tax=Parnassius mnemosyne TaxID=213953 RepID=A0AAV1M884_9NEOP
MKKSLSETNTRLTEMEKSFSCSSQRQDLFDSRLQALEVCSSQDTELITQIQNLENKIQYMEQQARRNNLEISGIPEKSNEDLSLYLRNITNFLGVELSSTDIVQITRIRPFNAVSGRPKAIVVKLSYQLLRDTILSAVRTKKELKLCDIGFRGEMKKIYLNEHLTPANKILYKSTREKAKVAQYKFVWIRDGKIFVRKNDISRSLCIKNSVDLQKVI